MRDREREKERKRKRERERERVVLNRGLLTMLLKQVRDYNAGEASKRIGVKGSGTM